MSSLVTNRREHRLEKWMRAPCSDELKFRIYHVDSRLRVCRLPGKLLLPFCIENHYALTDVFIGDCWTLSYRRT